jgi:hypothetical protein
MKTIREDDDDYVRQSRLYLRGCQRFPGALGFYQRKKRWPEITAAHELYMSPHPALLRKEIEARFLSKEPIESIARKTGYTAEQLQMYERLFYNVTDRLHNRSYITQHAIGENCHVGINQRDYEVLWKHTGFNLGPAALDTVIYKSFDAAPPSRMEEVAVLASHLARQHLAVKSLFSALNVPVNSFTALPIIEAHQRDRALARETGEALKPVDYHDAAVQETLASIPWAIGDSINLVDSADPDKTVKRISEEVAEADLEAEELRAGELIAMNLDQSGKKKRRAAGTKFPERR